jgi:mRNA interferase RelE/StbE
MKTIVYSARALKDLDALGLEAAKQVVDGLERYAVTGAGDVKALVDRPGYRLRVGRYRVVFAEDRHTVLAIEIGKRDTTTYKRR